MYINRATIIGNLTRNPEMKALPSGSHVTTFSVATNRVYKDKEGRRQEMTDYHNIVVFGRQAETSAQYLKKGQMVYVEGRLQTRNWDDADGKKNYRTEIVADTIQFGPKQGGSSGSDSSNSSRDNSVGSSGSSDSFGSDSNDGGIDYPQEEINPEDIPF